MSRIVLALSLAVAVLSPLAAEEQPAASNQGRYLHVVIFTLKKDAPKDEADLLIADVEKLLSKIPAVRSARAGKPADMSSPKFVIKDYDVGLVVRFDDFAGNDAYHKHPLHDQFVERHLKHLDKVLVYDFEAPK